MGGRPPTGDSGDLGPAGQPAGRVTVVIPCFDDGATVAQAVHSALAQKPREVVVVDDGSTDPLTLEVLAELARRVQVIRQVNAGLSAARNAGARSTGGPYLFFLDADDELAPGALDALAAALDRDAEAVMAWGDAETFGAFSSSLRSAPALDPWRLTYISDIILCLIRRDALEEVGGWQDVRCEDWDLWLTFASRGWRGIYVPQLTYRYRVQEEGRMWATDYVPNHETTYRELKRRHDPVFRRRWSAWGRSPAPWRIKVLFPLVSLLPISEYKRHRLRFLVARPGSFIKRTPDGRLFLRRDKALEHARS